MRLTSTQFQWLLASSWMPFNAPDFSVSIPMDFALVLFTFWSQEFNKTKRCGLPRNLACITPVYLSGPLFLGQVAFLCSVVSRTETPNLFITFSRQKKGWSLKKIQRWRLTLRNPHPKKLSVTAYDMYIYIYIYLGLVIYIGIYIYMLWCYYLGQVWPFPVLLSGPSWPFLCCNKLGPDNST